jgi:hypothetical protein
MRSRHVRLHPDNFRDPDFWGIESFQVQCPTPSKERIIQNPLNLGNPWRKRAQSPMPNLILYLKFRQPSPMRSANDMEPRPVAAGLVGIRAVEKYQRLFSRGFCCLPIAAPG